MNVYNKIESKFESVYRVDNPDYPDIVLREALMNAIIHRDYYIEGSILISLYDNRIEIMSIGGTMPGVTKELMIAGVSIPRNERLANVFLRLNLIEAYGTGIPRIFEAYAKHGLTPDIPITNGGFLISLPNMNAGKGRSTSRQEQIILEAFPKNEFTKEEAANATEMSVSGCYKLLQRMVKHGLLTAKRVGHGFRYRAANGK
jgi:ATP-dependent DNA helicase RecG